MKRIALFLALSVIFTASVASAGVVPNGGHIYLNCENFQIGGTANFLGTAGKTTDANGNCILTFPGTGPLGTFATARFWMPHSASVASSWGFSPVFTTAGTSGTIWYDAQVECSKALSLIGSNNAGDATPSADSGFALNPPGIAFEALGGGPTTGYTAVSPFDQRAGINCAVGECNDTPCVFRLTRVNGAGNPTDTANVYGVDLAFPTP